MNRAIDEVNRSFGQCCVSNGFFDEFYRHFLQQSKEIRNKFLTTEMEAQKRLLRTGISHLILTYKGALMSERKIETLAKSHSRNQLDIKPSMYPLWQASLFEAIKNHDPDFSEQTRSAWREVLDKGLSRMKQDY